MIDPLPARVAVNFHTLFSLVAAVVFLPLIDPLAKLSRRLLPDRPAAVDPAKPRHLDPHVLETPAEALGCAMRETIYLGDLVGDMLRQTMDVFESNDEKARHAIASEDNTVDHLYEAIKLYLVQVSRNELSEEESRRYFDILSFTTNLEHIGDIIDKNLMELAQKKIKSQTRFSADGEAELVRFHGRVVENLKLALGVFMSGDVKIARQLLDEKVQVRDAERAAAENHFARLREGRPESIASSALHLDVLRDLKRIHSHICAVAYPVLESAGQLRATRLLAAADAPHGAATPAALGPAVGSPRG